MAGRKFTQSLGQGPMPIQVRVSHSFSWVSVLIKWRLVSAGQFGRDG